MSDYDVFNGDADGICALHQLRLHEPRHSSLVTGVKRDISLLSRVNARAEDRVTVLDVSLDKNREALQQQLNAGAKVEYFDHHFAGDIPLSDNLFACIDLSADVCTSLLVSRHLHDAYLPWAVVGAFGDNLHEIAKEVAKPLALNDDQLLQLERLGTLLNYNGYGVTLDDLLLTPDNLYRAVSPFTDPFAFIADSPAYRLLNEGYEVDMAQANKLEIIFEQTATAAFFLPDESWARRVSGVLGNQLARQHPTRAHALLTTLPEQQYRISVRAPLNNKDHAHTLCMKFPTGGGRKAAAGVNALPADMLKSFLQEFKDCYDC